MKSTMDRRTFLKTSTLAGAGLLIGFHIPLQDKWGIPAAPSSVADTANSATEPFTPNAFLRIDTDGTITVLCPRSEMGQGIQTAVAMMVAEDLEADWSKVRVEQGGIDIAYGDQVTGGSTSTATTYGAARMAAATALTMLIAAAAQQWGITPADCHAELGFVYGKTSEQKLSYGELAPLAAEQSAASMAKFKPIKDFKIIGTRKPSLDIANMVTGEATFASDVRLPGMLYAVVARCPVFGGTVDSFDAAKALVVPGVRQVIQIDSGLAVVAENTWSAMQGRDALKIKWHEGKNAQLSTDAIRQQLIDDVKTNSAEDKAAPDAVTSVEAVYEQPYMAHTTMEAMSCVADVREDSCEVWVPSQDRANALSTAGAGSGVASRKITLHIPLIGCGWGRRLKNDYVQEATQISKEAHAPIKLIWTRDDDIQHDFYRPVSYHLMRADLDGKGKPLSWRYYAASEGIGGGSYEVGTGLGSLPYDISSSGHTSSLSLGVPVGYWRAVFNTNTAFVNESFIDELAVAAKQDPYEYRLGLMTSTRMKAVLQLAAEKAGWGTTLPKGSGRGIACFASWGASYVAQVAEVKVDDDGNVHVERVVCAVDCGVAVNLDSVEAQMAGGIIAGLSTIFKHEITLKNGRVEQHNFRDYPLLRMNEAPKIEVYVLPSDQFPTGIGEMSNPVTPPAVANAIFAATGKRIRRLPIRKSDLVKQKM